MNSSGRLKRWREYYLGYVKDDPCPADATLPKFGLQQVILPFGVLVSGFLISILLIVLEFLLKHLFPHQHPNNMHNVVTLEKLAKQSLEERKVKGKKRSVNKNDVQPKFQFLH
jgi:hypothetical protein